MKQHSYVLHIHSLQGSEDTTNISVSPSK